MASFKLLGLARLLPLLLIIACGTIGQAEIHPCPVVPSPPPPPKPSSFQVIGEARMALLNAYDLMSRDPEAQARARMVDYVLDANYHFLISQDRRFQVLAACSAGMVAEVLPDMAIFARPDDTARIKRAHEMFAAMGGTCEQLPLPDNLDPTTEEEGDEEELDLGLSPGDETPTSL